MRSKAHEKRADHGRNLAFQGSNRRMGIPTSPRLDGSHTCELTRPSAFTVTGIVRDSHPYSPKRSFGKPLAPRPAQPSMPIAYPCMVPQNRTLSGRWLQKIPVAFGYRVKSGRIGGLVKEGARYVRNHSRGACAGMLVSTRRFCAGGVPVSRQTMPGAPVPANPNIPGELAEVRSLVAWIDQKGDGDPFATHVRLSGDEVAHADFKLLELSSSRVNRCAFAGCCFTRSSFSDVTFFGCDFSNCDFSEANFTRCTFSSCKFMGADFTEAVFYRVELCDSTASYAAFTKAKLSDLNVRACDLSQAHLVEARLVRVSFEDVRFVGTSFFRTSLTDVDMTTCQLADIVLSDQMGELRGCVMDLYQAAGIARRLGVEIKD